ncbi:MAG: hypothetical protein JWP97_4067 [Labilithrix sp.]|nr:hypothetical protein [Labilithrix sp.]
MRSHRYDHRPLLHRVVAALLAVSFLALGARPAYADPSGTSPPTEEAKIARAGTFIFYGLSLVSFGATAAFYAKGNSAEADAEKIAGASGSSNAPVYDCRTADECSRLSQARRDQEHAREVTSVTLGIGIVTALVGTVALVDWIVESRAARQLAKAVTPSVSPQGGSLQLQGTF